MERTIKMRTIIFLDYFEDLSDAVPVIEKTCRRLASKPLLVSSNFDNSALSERLGLEIVYFDDLLSQGDYDLMDEYVYGMAKTWHASLPEREGLTVHKGISFGVIGEERAQRLFTPSIKNLQIVLNMAERFRPDKIILAGERDIFSGLVSFIEKNLRIPAEFVEVRKKRDLCGDTKRFVADLLSEMVDIFIRNKSLRRPIKGDILIDARLSPELKGLGKRHRLFRYLMEKGLRVRWQLIVKERVLFAPVLEDGMIAKIKGRRLRIYWRSAKDDRKFRDSFIYKGFSIWDVVERPIEELVLNDFAAISDNMVFLEKFYKALKPRVVVLREAVRMPEKTIVSAAGLSGARTFVVQHGLLAERYVYTRLFSDRIALWGSSGIEWYGRYGNDTSRCVVTGKPGHDALYSRMRDGSLSAGGGPQKDPRAAETILYVPSYFKDIKWLHGVFYPYDSEYVSMDAITAAMRHFPDKRLVIKVHPFDPVDIDRFTTSRLRGLGNVTAVKNADILKLIAESSLVITSLFSSSALDAVILDKPVIALNVYKREDLVPFVKYGVALGAKNSEELKGAISRILGDAKTREGLAANRPQFIRDYAYAIDGKATERVMNEIEKFISEAI